MKKLAEKRLAIENRIGSIAISALDLLNLVEKLAGDKVVTATSNGYRFEGVDDARQHIAAFSGNPRIEIGSTQLIFEDGYCTIGNGWRGDDDPALIGSLSFDLLARKTLLDYWRDKQFFLDIFFAMLASMLATNFSPQYFSLLKIDSFFLKVFLSYILFLSFILVFHKFIFFNKYRSVRYVPSESFLRRNFETVLVGFVGPCAGILFGYWLNSGANP